MRPADQSSLAPSPRSKYLQFDHANTCPSAPPLDEVSFNVTIPALGDKCSEVRPFPFSLISEGRLAHPYDALSARLGWLLCPPVVLVFRKGQQPDVRVVHRSSSLDPPSCQAGHHLTLPPHDPLLQDFVQPFGGLPAAAPVTDVPSTTSWYKYCGSAFVLPLSRPGHQPRLNMLPFSEKDNRLLERVCLASARNQHQVPRLCGRRHHLRRRPGDLNRRRLGCRRNIDLLQQQLRLCRELFPR
jgi:hypothetical protein